MRHCGPVTPAQRQELPSQAVREEPMEVLPAYREKSPSEPERRGSDGRSSRLSARDRQAAAIAARQHATITSRQLQRTGFSTSAVTRMVQRGAMQRLYHGVYVVGPVTPPLARELGAVLACQPAAFLSNLSALALWGLLPHYEGPIHVTVVGRDSRRRDGIEVHRTNELNRRDTRRHKLIPVTAPARSILESAPELNPKRLRRLVDEAQVRRLTTESQLNEAMKRAPRRPGTAALNTMLNAAREPALTRSEAEERALALIEAAGLPRPRVNANVEGLEVDFYWPEQQVVLEVDGFEYHRTRHAFETDHQRTAILEDAGLILRRATWWQLTEEPLVLTARLARALATGEGAHRSRDAA
ncbi:MAG: type IV toxin-antitoxin system AbiEi family antitoxin domain-containing protein [Thermoleophilaceae bacterium]